MKIIQAFINNFIYLSAINISLNLSVEHSVFVFKLNTLEVSNKFIKKSHLHDFGKKILFSEPGRMSGELMS